MWLLLAAPKTHTSLQTVQYSHTAFHLTKYISWKPYQSKAKFVSISLDQRDNNNLSISDMIHWISMRKTISGYKKKKHLQLARHSAYSECMGLKNRTPSLMFWATYLISVSDVCLSVSMLGLWPSAT